MDAKLLSFCDFSKISSFHNNSPLKNLASVSHTLFSGLLSRKHYDKEDDLSSNLESLCLTSESRSSICLEVEVEEEFLSGGSSRCDFEWLGASGRLVRRAATLT